MMIDQTENAIATDARELRGRAAYEAAQQQPIFGYGLRWTDCEPVEQDAWCAIGDAVAAVAARQLATAHASESFWQRAHHDAWVVIGRIDYALEQAAAATRLSDVRGWLATARAQIPSKQK